MSPSHSLWWDYYVWTSIGGIFKKYLKCYAVTGQYDSDLDIPCLVLVNTLRKNLCTNLKKKTLLKKHEITKLQSTVNNLPTYFYANNNLYRYLKVWVNTIFLQKYLGTCIYLFSRHFWINILLPLCCNGNQIIMI